MASPLALVDRFLAAFTIHFVCKSVCSAHIHSHNLVRKCWNIQLFIARCHIEVHDSKLPRTMSLLCAPISSGYTWCFSHGMSKLSLFIELKPDAEVSEVWPHDHLPVPGFTAFYGTSRAAGLGHPFNHFVYCRFESLYFPQDCSSFGVFNPACTAEGFWLFLHIFGEVAALDFSINLKLSWNKLFGGSCHSDLC